MSKLLELAERCEKAEGPDGDLGLDISIALDLPTPHKCPTEFLDAAILTVPKGWWWSAGDCSVSSDASVGPDVAYCDKDLLAKFDAGLHADLPHPSNPALALCSVALRAQAALEDQSLTVGG